MANIWKEFQGLLPKNPITVATVLSHNADGTSSVETPEGNLLRVLGTDVGVGLKTFIQGGRVIGEAPNLAAYTLEV